MRTIDVSVNAVGQVVIPDEIRRLLELTGEHRVRFVIDETGIRLTVPWRRRTQSLQSVMGSFPGKAGFSADLDDEIDEAMADALAEKYGTIAGATNQ